MLEEGALVPRPLIIASTMRLSVDSRRNYSISRHPTTTVLIKWVLHLVRSPLRESLRGSAVGTPTSVTKVLSRKRMRKTKTTKNKTKKTSHIR